MYEYEVLNIGGSSALANPINLQAKLNYLGSQGWTVTATVGTLIVLWRTKNAR